MGIIAEDDSDVAVISSLTLTMLRPHKVGFKKFVGDGCGKLRRKCEAWARNLCEQGCDWIVVVHDLDVHDEGQLRAGLVRSLRAAAATSSLVLIPKREIEAWLLYDAAAIAAAFRQSSVVPLPGDPELLRDPKKYLREVVRRRYRKTYLNTLHNPIIARNIKPPVLAKSKSFAPHFEFVVMVRRALR